MSTPDELNTPGIADADGRSTTAQDIPGALLPKNGYSLVRPTSGDDFACQSRISKRGLAIYSDFQDPLQNGLLGLCHSIRESDEQESLLAYRDGGSVALLGDKHDPSRIEVCP